MSQEFIGLRQMRNICETQYLFHRFALRWRGQNAMMRWRQSWQRCWNAHYCIEAKRNATRIPRTATDAEYMRKSMFSTRLRCAGVVKKPLFLLASIVAMMLERTILECHCAQTKEGFSNPHGCNDALHANPVPNQSVPNTLSQTHRLLARFQL